MNPWYYLLPPLVFLIPSRCFGAAASAPPSEALYALNVTSLLPAAGYEFGRYFDAAAAKGGMALVAPKPELARRPPPQQAALARPFPFVLDIPSVPPMPFERAFQRIVLKKETVGYDGIISRYASEAGLDPRLVKSIVAAESEFTARAVSPAGALGLMQVMPKTAGWMGVSGDVLFDPEENIRAGTRYLVYLFDRAWKRYHLQGVSYRNAPSWIIQRVVAAYNAGPKFLAHRRLYRETREYIRKVLLFYKSKVTELVAR